MSTTLLIIDDTPSDIRTLVELLRDQGFRIIVALNGTDGFNKAVTVQPALILLDRIMPGMDGLSVCRLLKSDPRTASIPVIFLTAMQAVEDKVEGFERGVCDYITKPWQPAEVIARLRVHIELHRRLRELPAPPLSEQPADKELSRAELRVHKAQSLYLQYIGATPTLTDIAHSVGTHARQLAEDFRQVTGHSAQNWLREKRMKLACELLLTSELEISRIAEQVGYTSAPAFSNAFKDYFGLAPSEYRRAAGLRHVVH
ncbi:MAG: response regulator [Methylovulum sp.]|nr:response regulator [Methylovulum sp.]